MSRQQQYDDEAEQQRLYHDSIRSYWTPERILNAKVTPCDDEETIHGMKKQGYGAGSPPTKVLDGTRKELPYKNVGKLFFVQDKKDFIGTAYVVDIDPWKNIVFTAAHNLYYDGFKSENILFKQALQSNGESIGQFSEFAPNSWVVSSNWVPNSPYPFHYDIGAIKLGKNDKGKDVGDVSPGFKIETEPNAPPGYEKDKTEWKIIGYPKGNDMYESDGVFNRYYKASPSIDAYLVERTNPVFTGMSGGPWLPKDATGKANGNQSTISPDYTYTPFYAKATVDDILSKLSKL